jgi:guanylate kinase
MAFPSRFLIVIGPSGAGKSSVVRELHRRHVVLVQPTWTTRPPRHDETEGSLEHRFVSDAEFEELLRAGFFGQTGSISGLPHRYGLPAFIPHDDGPLDTVILRASYVDQVTRLVPGSVVYQIRDRGDRIARRIRARGCPPAELASRVWDNIAEARSGRLVAHRTFVNHGSLEQLVDKVTDAIAIDFAGRSVAAVAA